jgi:glycosyltransferase involved in cell wall biosynthesis
MWSVVPMLIPTLYISRTGMLEPLGQSQVLSYVRGLSRNYRITLVSFEKTEELLDLAAVERIRQLCKLHDIRWLPQRYRHRPRALAVTWNVFVLFCICLWEVLRGRARLIHARSYIPAAAALVVSRLTGIPFIFDMRSLWPEELVTSGRIARDSPLFRLIERGERACLKYSAGVVSLTDAAVAYLRNRYPREMEGQRVVVIPTCTDLDRFRPVEMADLTSGPAPRVYGCHGSILSGWFRADLLSVFLHAVMRRDPGASFQIITRDDPARVRTALGGDKQFHSRLSIFPMPAHKVHEALQRQHVSVMFYAGGAVSELGRSPTRMGEVLGCGQPVVANEGVGDVARTLRDHGVGVVLHDGSPQHVERCLDELERLLADPDLAHRCRRTAESVYSLENGIRDYEVLYALVLDSAIMSGASV